MENEKNILDLLFDPENNEPITLYDAQNKPTKFEQVATIPLNDSIYAILAPLDKIQGVNDDEAFVFEIIENDEEEISINLCSDFKIVDAVFEEYYKLIKEEEEK